MVFGVRMDSVPGSSEPTSPIPKRKGHRVRRFALAVAALGVLLLVFILFFTLTSKPDPTFLWLTQAEMARLTHSSPLTRLKDKFMNLTAPLWRRYWNRQPQVLIDSTLLTLPTDVVEQMALGAPNAPNADGLQAWIVSPSELKAMKVRLEAVRGPWLVGKPRIQTASGVRGEMFMGRTVQVDGNNTPAGVTIDVVPRAISDSIKLTIGVTATEAVAPQSAGNEGIKTNLAVACRALLPNTGGLVVDGGNAKDASGRSYWLIISPTIVDTRGNPVKR